MKKRLIAVLMTMGLMITASQASAFWCTGKPSVNLSLQAGTVIVNIGYGFWTICSLRETMGGIDPRVCEKMYSSLLLAEATNTQSIIYFTNEAGDCQSIGNWVNPSSYTYYIDFLAGPAN